MSYDQCDRTCSQCEEVSGAMYREYMLSDIQRSGIILVDDGSYDGSEKICDLYQNADDRIIVLHKENKGLVSARKAGLQISHGEYIAYVDGDDWIEPDMVEKLNLTMQESGADIVTCGHFIDTGNTSKRACHDMPNGYYGKRQLVECVYPEMIVGEEFSTGKSIRHCGTSSLEGKTFCRIRWRSMKGLKWERMRHVRIRHC